MLVKAIKSRKIIPPKDDLFLAIKESFSAVKIKEKSVIAITSKIVSIGEGRCININDVPSKDYLVEREAQYYLPASPSTYGFCLSINHNTLVASAGIDKSNSNGYYVLWPRDPQASANKIRSFFKKSFNLKNIGVIITDSHVQPLRWGVIGTSIAHTGFESLNSYIGKPDIFGQNLTVTNASVAEGLAVAAVLAMGEGKEQTPMALISDVPFVKFVDRNPTQKELAKLSISKEEDIYSPMLNAIKWEKGKNR